MMADHRRPFPAAMDALWGVSQSLKRIISALAVALALAFTGPAFAGDVTAAKIHADCKKAGGMWDATTKTCSAKKM
jgi:hypothetical protein